MTECRQETILFVDDEESILEIVGEYFRHKGYRVMTANNGLDAVKIIEREQVDCCFTDINMPGMDGLEFAEKVRSKDSTIPVVVMTGYPSLENTIHTLKNGVVDFLIKPVNLEQMELTYRRVVRERRLFLENLLLSRELEGKKRIEAVNKALLSKVEELNKMNRIMHDFGALRGSSDLFRRVVDLGLEITGADVVRFFIINDSSDGPIEVVRSLNGALSTPGSESHEAEKRLVMEIAGDGIPLLISESCGIRGLPPDILSIMVVPLKIKENVFAVLSACVREGEARFNEKDLYYLSFMTQKAANSVENIALYENIYENFVSTLSAFVTAVEARDLYTNQHSNRVAEMAVLLGKELGCNTEELEVINFAGRLHDIGKIGIRDEILLKPGRLDDSEFEKIKEHPVIGANIVGQLGLWDREAEIIKHHHERFDGYGYPDGLKGDEVPLLARILSVADAYDAMASDRAYRKKMDREKVVRIIKSNMGGQFDPLVAEAFLRLMAAGKLGQ